MANRIFNALIEEKINNFKLAFNDTSKTIFWDEKAKSLIHPGEFGMYRESVCKDFFKFVIPQKLSIGSGFVINGNDQISTQCDIVIYDKENTPLIEDSERQKFFPVESIVAIGEIKSTLSKSEFKESINKLSKIKSLREYIAEPSIIYKKVQGEFDPINCYYDNILSFLICKKFDFDLKDTIVELDNLYASDVKPWQKHNVILSLDDGMLTYFNEEKEKIWVYPYHKSTVQKNTLINEIEGNNAHLKMFSTFLFGNTSSISIFMPDIWAYLDYKFDSLRLKEPDK